MTITECGNTEPGLTNAEILKLAIDTYGPDEQMRMCVEEMAELTVALNKYHRDPGKPTCDNVVEEIADVCIMIQQMKLIFEEKEIAKIYQQKIKRLEAQIEVKRAKDKRRDDLLI